MGTFCPLEQNNTAFVWMKGRGVSLPLHVHNKVPVETCDLVCHRIKSVSHVLEKMLKMLSVGHTLWMLLCCTCEVLLRKVVVWKIALWLT